MARVCLSFDNGPDPRGTPHVLGVLQSYGISAYFFVLGHKLAEPGGMDLARRTAAAGHRLGNHSYSHRTPLGLDLRVDAVEQELERTEQLLGRVCDGSRWFRPFGGGGKLGPHLLSPAAVEYMERGRYTCVLWNSVPGDWLDPNAWVERALADLEAREHTLVVLHDFLLEPMVHLERFIDGFLERGHTTTVELPPDCLPIVEGRAGPGLSAYVQDPQSDERAASADPGSSSGGPTGLPSPS